MTTAETARRLGVKPQTVYAYVSRGLLARRPDGRRSLFEPAAVERLAQRARRTDRSRALEVVVDTELTLLDPDGRLAFRGRDAVELARYRSFEAVAQLLWDAEEDAAWTPRPAALRATRSVMRDLPEATRPADRLRAAIPVAAAHDPDRGDRRPEAVRAAAAALVATMVEALPLLGAEAAPTAPIAARLWSRLSAQPPRPAQLRALDAALVLLADHELAASTLAARVAASAWADPYLVVLAGLCALGGPLHGAASTAVEDLLRSVEEPGDADAALDRAGRPLPGFGHAVYRHRDPRADLLLELLAGASDPRRLAAARAVLDAAGRRAAPAPNVDFALGALVIGCGMVPGAGQAIFAISRTAGLAAHALEEYVHRLRFRPRAAYVGPLPRPSG